MAPLLLHKFTPGLWGNESITTKSSSFPQNVKNNRGGTLRWHHARGKQWTLILIMTGYYDYSKLLGIHRGQLIKYHQDRPTPADYTKKHPSSQLASAENLQLSRDIPVICFIVPPVYLWFCLLLLLKRLSIILFFFYFIICLLHCRSTSISLPRGSGHSIFSRND